MHPLLAVLPPHSRLCFSLSVRPRAACRGLHAFPRRVPAEVLPGRGPRAGAQGQPEGEVEPRLHSVGKRWMLGVRSAPPAVPELPVLERLRGLPGGVAAAVEELPG